MRASLIWWIVALVAAVGVATSAASSTFDDQRRVQRDDHQSGAYLFRVFCASCHGESGNGDGPVAQMLNRPPSDLTRITLRAGGVFPRETVIRKIDGRLPILAHGREDMPIWGEALKTTEGQDERVIRQRIEAIASHIESIQVKTP